MIPAAILLIALVGANLLGWIWIWSWAEGRDAKARAAVELIRDEIENEVLKQWQRAAAPKV